MPVECGQHTRTVATAILPSSVSQCQIMPAYDAPMHRNNRSTFLLRQIESELTRAITPHHASLNKVFPGHVVMCLARLSMAPISYICRNCTFVRRVALLFPHYPRFYYPPLDSSLPSCLTLTLLPHRPTFN